MSESDFLRKVSQDHHRVVDVVVAYIWYTTRTEDQTAVAFEDLSAAVEVSGRAKPHSTRLRESLRKDRRIVRSGNDSYKLTSRAHSSVEAQFSKYVQARPIQVSDSVLPHELFDNQKNYVKKVVLQLNRAYEESLFDCCAVMARRLLETLIIEAYERLGADDILKGDDGNFLFFSGMLARLESDGRLKLSRNALGALKAFKKLGDLSAHNRRFNARKPDIDRIRDDVRLLTEELMNAA